MHPAIHLAAATRLGAEAPVPADEPPGRSAPPGPLGRARAAARRAGGAVLDRVGDRAAAATADQVAQLRAELAATRAELAAEIELLRAELEGRPPDGS